jgi:plasmid replication initiation protein
MNNKNLIYKDNRIIEASYKLTINEQRIILFCISQINSLEKLNANQIFVVSASEYSSVFGLDKDWSFREMKNAVTQLFERRVKVGVTPEESDEFRWISFKSISKSKQSIGVRFTTDIAPFLSELEGNFTKYKLLSISSMGSVYSIRIYEMLMQWRTTKSVKITIDKLRYRMQIEDGKYKEFSNFKQKVIDTAIKEINESSDIMADYEMIKEGRKVIAINFRFEFKNSKLAKEEAKQEIKDVIKNIRKVLK